MLEYKKSKNFFHNSYSTKISITNEDMEIVFNLGTRMHC